MTQPINRQSYDSCNITFLTAGLQTAVKVLSVTLQAVSAPTLMSARTVGSTLALLCTSSSMNALSLFQATQSPVFKRNSASNRSHR